MVFPEVEHGVHIFAELIQKCQRNALPVDRTGCRSCRVNGNADHIFAHIFACSIQRPAHGGFKRLYIVERMLPVHAFVRILVFSFGPSPVNLLRLSCYHPAVTVYYKRTGRIGTEIHTYYILTLAHDFCLPNNSWLICRPLPCLMISKPTAIMITMPLMTICT